MAILQGDVLSCHHVPIWVLKKKLTLDQIFEFLEIFGIKNLIFFKIWIFLRMWSLKRNSEFRLIQWTGARHVALYLLRCDAKDLLPPVLGASTHFTSSINFRIEWMGFSCLVNPSSKQNRFAHNWFYPICRLDSKLSLRFIFPTPWFHNNKTLLYLLDSECYSKVCWHTHILWPYGGVGRNRWWDRARGWGTALLEQNVLGLICVLK